MQKQIPSSYRSVPSFPDYYMNDQGQVVKVYDNGQEHVLSSNHRGTVTLYKDGKRFCKSLSSIFWEVFYSVETSKGRNAKPVHALKVGNLETKWIKFNSLAEASEATGVSVSSISKIINGRGYTSHGWTFRSEV